MTRFAVSVACVGVFCLGLTQSASAEPVTITGGSLVFPTGDQSQFGPISLTGTRGFSLHGFVDSGETSIPGLGCCFSPGSAVGGSARLLGFAWRETSITLDGQTFAHIGGAISFNQLHVDLFATMITPASPMTVTAPFTVAFGRFVRADQVHPAVEVPIRGAGTVSVTFLEVPGSFTSGGVRYDFTQPTPEPATLTLMSAGLIGATTRLRKRRAANASEANRRIRFVKVRRRQP
jgi:hypothetical protein